MFKRIIVIIGMPRSGTSWLSQIVESCPRVRFRLSPLFSYAFKNFVSETSSQEDWEELLQNVYLSHDVYMEQTRNRKSGHYPVFKERDEEPEFLAIKMVRFHNLVTAMLRHFDNLKMVAIVRHPAGAIHSWLRAPREFRSYADPLKEWRTGSCRKTGPGEFWGFEDWKKVTRLHMKMAGEYPDRFYLLRYERLVDRVVTETKKLFEFLGLPYTSQTADFLKECNRKHNDDTYAVFKDPRVKDRWRTELQPQIRDEIIEDLQGTDLECFLS